jgi:hypothetical protein
LCLRYISLFDRDDDVSLNFLRNVGADNPKAIIVMRHNKK